jgi:signal transduction histidine kinase
MLVLLLALQIVALVQQNINIGNSLQDSVARLKDDFSRDMDKYQNFVYFTSRSIKNFGRNDLRDLTDPAISFMFNKLRLTTLELTYGPEVLSRKLNMNNDFSLEYILDSEKAKFYWNQMDDPLMPWYATLSTPDLVSNIFVMRHIAVIYNSGLAEKVGLVVATMPIDNIYMTDLVGTSQDLIAVVNVGGILISSSQWPLQPEAISKMHRAFGRKRAGYEQLNIPGKGDYYFAFDSLFREKGKDIADIGILVRGDEFRQLMTTNLIVSLILFIVISAAATLVALSFSNRLTVPLLDLRAMVLNFQRNLEMIPRPSRIQDEIDELQDGFGRMTESIWNYQESLVEYSQNLNESNRKLQELDRLKTEFLNSVAHEVRTPLTSMVGFARLIERFAQDDLRQFLPQDVPKVAKTVNNIVGNAQIIFEEGMRLTDLLNDFLDLAKIESGKVEWKMEMTNLRTAAEHALISVKPMFEKKGLQVELIAGKDLPNIVCDKNKIIQVLINLLSNAAKFTDQGKVVCDIQATGSELLFSVSDTGIGISPDNLGRIFEKFKQVGEIVFKDIKGTGLGLAICKEIVEYHRGRIWAESEYGKGTTVSFALPLAFSVGRGEEKAG